MENLISLVKNLQRGCTALADHGGESALPTDWDVLPSVAVVGSQSSGKSSVLETLVGKDFLPKGPGIVTRRPLVLQLHRIDTTEEYALFLDRPDKRYTNFAEVRKEITNEIDRVTGRSKGISPDPIHLSIFSPTVVNLTLIDLPGLTKIAVYGQSDNIVQEIESMVRAFIEKPDCIILAVSPANQDLATSDAIKIAREVDPKGERTFGVLTKIDLMDKGTHAVDILEGRFYQLQFPWIGVVNRSQQDLSKSMDMTAARLRERDYFANSPEYNHLAHRMGSENLARSLSKHLESFIRSKMSISYLCNDSSLKCQVTKKNRLQGYMLRAYGTFPTYMLSTQHEEDRMTFECTVKVKDQAFVSAKRHVHRKDAEEDAANVAYNAVMGDETMDALIQMTNKSSFNSINILNEYVQKKRLSDPASADAVYKSSKVSVQSQQTLWVSTLTVGGQSFLGDIAKSKRLSVQQVAATAVKSMLEAGNAILINMVLSKRVRVEVPRKKSSKRGAGVRTAAIERKKREIVASTHDEDVDSESVLQGK